MKYTHESGITVSGNHPFIDTFIEVVREAKERERKWVEKMEKLGYMAAHPNDGWNDREQKEIVLSNPYFNKWPDIGDKIVIGDPDKYKVVTIIGVRESLIGNLFYYRYRRATHSQFKA